MQTYILLTISLLWVGWANTQDYPLNTCCYKFAKPELPSYTLPPSQPISPGDITLNPLNPIILHDATALYPAQGCNGNNFEYYDKNNGWLSSYTGSDGKIHATIDNFYATADNKINVRTIQTWQSNLERILDKRFGRLWITCNNGLYSCVQFTINGNETDIINPTCGVPPVPTTISPSTTTTLPPIPTITILPSTTTTTLPPVPTTTILPSTTTLPPIPTTVPPTVFPTLPTFSPAPSPRLRPINTCCYKFTNPELPQFILPPAQPYSPGDETLNPLNPIIMSSGDPLSAGCNGDHFEFWDPQYGWNNSYVGTDGQYRTGIDLFYATGTDMINIRTIQTWQSNMATILNGRYGRLWITCNNGFKSCAEFTINGQVETVTETTCIVPTTTILPTLPPIPTLTTTSSPTLPIINNTCCYKFSSPQLPSFSLPASTAPSDTTLNIDNPLELFDTTSLSKMRCTGSKFEYYDNGEWTSTYTDDVGITHNTIDLFYIYNNIDLNAKVLKPSETALRNTLQGKFGRIWLSCDDNEPSCAQFTIEGASRDAILPTCPKKPTPRTDSSSGTLSLSVTLVIILLLLQF